MTYSTATIISAILLVIFFPLAVIGLILLFPVWLLLLPLFICIGLVAIICVEEDKKFIDSRWRQKDRDSDDRID